MIQSLRRYVAHSLLLDVYFIAFNCQVRKHWTFSREVCFPHQTPGSDAYIPWNVLGPWTTSTLQGQAPPIAPNHHYPSHTVHEIHPATHSIGAPVTPQ